MDGLLIDQQSDPVLTTPKTTIMHEMDATAYRSQIARLGLTQEQAARLLGVNARTSRRWALDERAIPGAVERLLWACEQHPELIDAFSDRTRWTDATPHPTSE